MTTSPNTWKVSQPLWVLSTSPLNGSLPTRLPHSPPIQYPQNSFPTLHKNLFPTNSFPSHLSPTLHLIPPHFSSTTFYTVSIQLTPSPHTPSVWDVFRDLYLRFIHVSTRSSDLAMPKVHEKHPDDIITAFHWFCDYDELRHIIKPVAPVLSRHLYQQNNPWYNTCTFLLLH